MGGLITQVKQGETVPTIVGESSTGVIGVS